MDVIQIYRRVEGPKEMMGRRKLDAGILLTVGWRALKDIERRVMPVDQQKAKRASIIHLLVEI